MDNMNKRILIAILLSVAVLVAYPFIVPTPKPPRKDIQASQGVEQPAANRAENPTSAAQVLPVTAEVSKEEHTITIDTDLYKAIFTNKGGVIKHWELKKYWTDVTRQNSIVLIDPGKEIVAAYPLSTSVENNELNNILKDGLYKVDGSDLKLSAGNPTGTLSFTLVDSKSGKGFKKTFTFHNDTYTVDVDLIPVNITESYAVSTGSNFGIHEWGEARMLGFVGPITMVGSKLEKDKVSKITGPVYHDGEIQWTAIQDKYFLSALIPKEKVNRVIVKKDREKDVQSSIEVTAGRKISLVLYAGPKESKQLESLGVGLDKTIPFGWFMFWELGVISWLAKALFYILQVFHKYSGNYGISIIFLTTIIKIIFVPLTYKSMKSMKAMQRLQPELQKLQKKHKDDKVALNKAMMELYKTHKVNPLGGCLPMLLQLPVFMGLYNLLAYSIELRQSPLFLWIKDLSLKDPYYVLPIIMGISMLLQQKMSPSTVDPTQAKIMLIMPVIFTFFFLNFPSGLVLYWLVNNLLTVGQQVIQNKYFSGK
ncbi:MAG: membrane protein insertase YidC [Nitrospirae bacterium]|nr:membrane protein insertase YidC [Nitrospirota bacterium]